MTLQSRCILSEREESDGFRISVMSRHTMNDGVTPNPLITPDKYDAHMPQLAPPSALVGAWHRGELGKRDAAIFERFFMPAYMEYLQTQRDVIMKLGRRALEENVTVLCIESEISDTRRLLCHRKYLVEACRKLTPGLDVKIR